VRGPEDLLVDLAVDSPPTRPATVSFLWPTFAGGGPASDTFVEVLMHVGVTPAGCRRWLPSLLEADGEPLSAELPEIGPMVAFQMADGPRSTLRSRAMGCHTT
jgi:hypothetical protein